MEFKNIGEILEKIDEIMLSHLMLNDDAMRICHVLGYNGFKRMHRWNQRKFNELHIAIENHATDKFRMVLGTDVKALPYKPVNLKDHFVKWDAKLKEDIAMLGHLNNAYREMTGVSCKIVKKAICKMAKNHEKTGRWIKRLDESGFNAHDAHSLDDYVHKCYKAKELKAGY